VETCSDCGCPLQSLDLPCPRCAAEASLPPRETLHRYSRTFEYRASPFRYRPDEAATEINQWLAQQTGLCGLTMTLHFFQAHISSVTANCVATSAPETPVVRLERVSLGGGFLGRHRQPAGVALNDWADRHPERKRLNYWSVASGGVPVEPWILYVEIQDGVQPLAGEETTDTAAPPAPESPRQKKRYWWMIGGLTLATGVAALVVGLVARGPHDGSAAAIARVSPHAVAPAVGSGSGSGSGVTRSRDVDACSLLSSSQIERVLALGSPPTSARSQTGDGSDECTHLTGGTGPAVTVQAGTTVVEFENRYKTTNGEIAGIGTQAAVYSGLPGAAILARQGAEWVEVYVEYVAPAQALTEAEALAKVALTRLTNG
jgi:hypothetical protein